MTHDELTEILAPHTMNISLFSKIIFIPDMASYQDKINLTFIKISGEY
jgi:hypothetical protein